MVRIFIFLALFLSACSGGAGLNLSQYDDLGATPQRFHVCHGYGCHQKTLVGLRTREWNSVRTVFATPSKDAAEERAKIGQAIALIEYYVGPLAGTQDDLPKAPLVRSSYTEQDCIDETVNTTKYLGFLEKDGLLKFHRTGSPVYKGLMVDGVYPHNSASIVEIQSGEIYVVDSYIYENAATPDIRPYDSWRYYRIEDLPERE